MSLQQIETFLPLLSHKKKVIFALHCTKDVLEHADKKNKKVIEKTIDLVDKWIETGAVSVKELETASSAAAAAAAAASSAAYASSAAVAAYAASSAAAAASSAASAASYAASASYAAYAAYAADREGKYEEYWKFLMELLEFTMLEKRMYDVTRSA